MSRRGRRADERQPRPRAAPRHVQALRKRVENVAGGDQARATIILRTVTMIAIAQMLPPSAIKGGTAMKLRLGMDNSRFSKDLDLVRSLGLDDFLADYDRALRAGWGGFTGEVRPSRAVARPKGVPTDYIMASRDIKVSYNGRDLMTLPLEVGHDELDDTVDPPTVLSDDIPELFAELGLPAPAPVPVVAHDHQIAQKLHAVSGPGSDRAHDLVDLQLLEATCPFDDEQVGMLCERLFAFRRAHSWPPRVEPGSTWEGNYTASSIGLSVLPDLGSAILWVNSYIARLDTARVVGGG